MNPLTIVMALAPLLPQLITTFETVSPGIANLFKLLQPTTAANPGNTVELIQIALNELQTVGEINFGAPLTVDGQFGGRTFAAIKVLIAKFGLTLEEPAATTVYQMMASMLAKL